MTTDLFGTSPATPSGTAASKHHGRRVLALGFVASTAMALFIGGMGATASAAPGDHSDGTTTAIVGVSSTITLAGLTPSFHLNGLPSDLITGNGAVTMAVTTANLGGYSVTVQAATATLVALTPGNTDSIPIGNLGVRETGGGAFTGLSSSTPVLVHNQTTRSIATGDLLSNDYQIAIPFVADDTYSATLNYIATAS